MLKSNGDLQLSSVTGDTRAEVCFGHVFGGPGLSFGGPKVKRAGHDGALKLPERAMKKNHLLNELSLDKPQLRLLAPRRLIPSESRTFHHRPHFQPHLQSGYDKTRAVSSSTSELVPW